jgi:prepilin-type N-terminal cleavage/methylation domain-containing protein
MMMRFQFRGSGLGRSAFTLVELLAAMALMAIVMPVAIEGLRIAHRAGEVGHRKVMAARAMDRLLNEYVVMNQRQSGASSGTTEEGNFEFQYSIKVENWREDTMRVVTCEVTYPVQGQNFYVRGSTLIEMQTR